MKFPIRRTLLCVLTCAAAFVAVPGQGAPFSFITTFGGDSVGQLPADWSADLSAVPAVSTAASAHSDAQSVAFTASGQGMKVAIPATDAIQWDFWIRPTATSRSLTVGTLDSSNRYGIWVTFGAASGQVSYYTNDTWNTIPGTTYSPNQWYKVRVVGRLTPAKSFDLYLSAAGSEVLPALPQGRALPVRDPLTADFVSARVGAHGFVSAAYFDDSAIRESEADGFESNAAGFAYPDEWDATGTVAPEILGSGADGTSRSLNIYHSGNRLELPVEVADEVVADFSVYPTGLGRSLTFTFFDQFRRQGPYLSFGVSSGQLSYYANEAWTTVPGLTFTANAWYRVRIVARTLPARSFDVYVSAAGSNTLPSSPQGAGLPFRDPEAGDVAAFGLDGFGLTAACRVDEVEITQGLDPLSPAPGAPAANDTTYMPAPSFDWLGSAAADLYEVQISADSGFNTLLDSDAIATNRYVHAQPFSPGDLYWRVRAKGAGNLRSMFSAGRKLTIQTPTNVYNIAAGASAASIQSTIQGAVTPAVINFAAGQHYTLAPTGSALINLSGKSDLIINGNGASITFTNPMCGLLVLNNSQRVLIRDLTVDFDPVPFSVGTIVSTDSATAKFTMTLDAGMPEFDSAHMWNNWTWGVLLDPNVPGRLKAGAPLVINTVKQVEKSGNTFTLQLTSPSNLVHFTQGAKYIQFARTNGGKTLVSVVGSNDVTCSNITNYAISAAHYSFIDGGGLKLLGCQSLIKAGRWFGGNADGVHARYNAPGPWVEGCEFEGIGDDSVALYSKSVYILQKISNNALRLGTEFFNLTPGDRFTVFNPRDGLAVAQELKVETVTKVGNPATHYDVTLSPALTATVVTSNSDPLQNDQVFNRTRLNKGFVLRGNTFRNIRRYGTVVRASSGIIDGNYYEGISDIPIVFRNEPDFWRNGLQSTDIQVTGNVILDSGFSPGGQEKGLIHLSIYKLGYLYGGWRGHRRILIADNEIWNWQDRGIEVRNAGELVISNNLITAEAGVTFDNTRPHYGIYVENVENSLLTENEILESRPLTEEIEVVGSSNVQVEP